MVGTAQKNRDAPKGPCRRSTSDTGKSNGAIQRDSPSQQLFRESQLEPKQQWAPIKPKDPGEPRRSERMGRDTTKW